MELQIESREPRSNARRTHASAAKPSLELNADPALNPNHPKFNSAAPSSTKGTLCARDEGAMRCPTTSEATSAEQPEQT